jgi:hypothetical protein
MAAEVEVVAALEALALLVAAVALVCIPASMVRLQPVLLAQKQALAVFP